MQPSHIAAKNFLKRLKRNPCKDCKKKFPYYVMEFDHVVPRNGKTLTVAALSQKLGLKRLADIVEQCDVVCANCHKVRTHKRRKK